MKKSNLSHKVTLAIFALFLTWILSWFVRGIYDQAFMMEGTILTVNCTNQPIDVTIDFPSSKQHQFTIQPNTSHELKEHDTGEGNLAVLIPGRSTQAVGYVTSMNGIIVLSIDDKDTTFSQIFP